jgi:hypothetical protein
VRLSASLKTCVNRCYRSHSDQTIMKRHFIYPSPFLRPARSCSDASRCKRRDSWGVCKTS